MSHPVDEDIVMEDESHHPDTHTALPGGSDPSGSSGGFEPSPNLRARMEKLAQRRIDASWITFPKDAREFRGGNAMVLEARMGKPKAARKKVAVKKPIIRDNKDLEQAVGLAIREAEFLAELTHPNIVRFKGFVEDMSKGKIWLVFPWADYGNLRDFVASERWEILERISLISDVVNGLASLHGRKTPICHGDLKSLNVLVFRGVKCRAAITDFGSARHLARRAPNTQIEQVGSQARSTQPLNAAFCPSTNTITLTGNNYSLRWAAPELLIEDQLSLQSDIWALGWIAYEVVTNSLPFQDVISTGTVIKRVLAGELPSLTDNAQLALINELCSLMTLCWKINPTDRPTADSCRKSIKQMPMWAPKMGSVERIVSVDLLSELGHLYQSRGDSASALDSFGDAIKKSRESGDEQKLVSSLSDLARVHRLRKGYNEVIALYSEIWEIYAKSIDNHPWKIDDGLRDLAELRRLRNECNRATEVHVEGRKIQEEERIAKALCKIAQHRRLQNLYEEAIRIYSQVLEIGTDLGDRRGKADALWGLAEVHRRRSEYEGAIPLYSEALDILTGFDIQEYLLLDNRKFMTDLLLGLADVHRLRGEYDKAALFYLTILKPQDIYGNPKAGADALWGLANPHRLRAEYDLSALLDLQRPNLWTIFSGRELRADALWGLADMHRLLGEPDWAMPLYSKALEIWTSLGDTKGRAVALAGLADVHRFRYEDDKALPLYREAMLLFIAVDDARGRDSALSGYYSCGSSQGLWGNVECQA